MANNWMQLEYEKRYTELDMTALGFERVGGINSDDFPVYRNGGEIYTMKKIENGRMTFYICWNYSHAKRVRK